MRGYVDVEKFAQLFLFGPHIQYRDSGKHKLVPLPGVDTRTFQPVTKSYDDCDPPSPIFRYNDLEISY
jgi:hypothetical protein